MAVQRWRIWSLAAVLAAGIARADDARPPVWPLDQPPVLTSSFGEYRPTHVHAGIDLGTAGRSGRRCFAVGDGWVARLRMSPFGYGKALYVQLDSGPLVVYAHLSRFGSPMAERARSEQRRLGAYTFDISLPPGQMRVERGQVVAWSGQTGVGVPHLHFEVRDGDVAQNPQQAGFAVPDTLPPVIEDVEVLPLDAGSHVDGARDRRVVRLTGAPAAERALPVAGRLGFAVRAWDAAVAGPWRQAPYRYELRVDGRSLFRAVLERLDYANSGQVDLEYDAERLVERGEESFLLFTRPGTRLEGREAFDGTDGVLRAPAPAWSWRLRPAFEIGPGRHEAEVEVTDAAGHVTTARLPLWVSRGPRVTTLRGEMGAGVVRLVCAAEDPDAESLQVNVTASADLGRSWSAVPLRRAPRSGLWLGETPWNGGAAPLILHAAAREPSGLEAVRTWASGALPPAPGALPIVVRSRWQYGRLEVEVEPAAPVVAAPVVALVLADSARMDLPLQQVDLCRYGAARDLESLPEKVCGLEVRAAGVDGRRAEVRRGLAARIARRGQALSVVDLDPRLEIDIPAEALLEDVALRVRAAAAPDLELGPELTRAGPCLWVEPPSAVLDKQVRLSLRPATEDAAPPRAAASGVAADGRRLGLFWVNRGGKLRWLSSERRADGALVGSTRFLGLFTVLADDTPPRIGDLRLVGRGRETELLFLVVDRGADLGDGGVRVELDGAPAIPEWDPETGEVVVRPDAPLARGTHRLRIRASDRVGNAAEKALTFKVP